MTTTVPGTTRTSAPAGPAASGSAVGSDRLRVDAPLKVTGLAAYAADQAVPNAAHLAAVTSTVARGRIVSVDTFAAQRVPGVLLVMSHENAPRLRVPSLPELWVLQSDKVRYRGQFVAAAVAETLEAARHAASLIEVTYTEEDADVDRDKAEPRDVRFIMGTRAQASQGDTRAALASAAHVVSAEYTTPMEFHAAMEPHPVIATWSDGGRLNPRAKVLTLHDSTQGASVVPTVIAPLFGLLPTQVEVISPYVGGGFGGKGMPHSHVVVAALAAKLLPGRPVKFVETRRQVFTTTGYRPHTRQQIALAADENGRLVALEHEATYTSSHLVDMPEPAAMCSRLMYATPNRRTSHRAIKQHLPASTFMRAPGEFPGMFALETAMDELAHAVGLDPIELRVRNEPAVDPESGKPWSTRKFLDCLHLGAEQFGWTDRPRVGERREGRWRIGYGVAGALFGGQHMMSTWARIRFLGGRYQVELAASDIGTGARTILLQIAADALGVSVADVHVELGRSTLPFAIMAGGSTGTSTWGNSVVAAAEKFRAKYGTSPGEGDTVLARGEMPKGFKDYSRNAFGACFVEARVAEDTGEVRVPRALGVYDGGRIINPRTARSQLVGGIVMGISAALFEDSYVDTRHGAIIGNDLAGYHIASHADIGDIDATWVDSVDPWYGANGAKGIGEVSITGVPAAVSNAIFNATGVRLRDLPFTPDRLVSHVSANRRL